MTSNLRFNGRRTEPSTKPCHELRSNEAGLDPIAVALRIQVPLNSPGRETRQNRRGSDPRASHAWRVAPAQQAPWSRARRGSAKRSQAKPKGCVPNWLSRRCHCKGPFLNHEPWRSAFGQTVAWTRWLRDWPAGMWCEEIINKPALMQASGQNLRWGRERRRLRMSASEAAAGGKNLGY